MGTDSVAGCYFCQKAGVLPVPAAPVVSSAEPAPAELWETLADLPYAPEMTSDSFLEWAIVFESIQTPFQAEAAQSALEFDLVESPDEMADFLAEAPPFYSAGLNEIDLLNLPLNDNEAYVLGQLSRAYSEKGIEGILDLAYELNVRAQLGPYPQGFFPGEMETEICREKILAQFLAANPQAKAELENWAPDEEKLGRDIFRFFSLAQLTSAVAEHPYLQAFIQENWRDLRPFFGPLFYQDAKYLYHYALGQELQEQGIAFNETFSGGGFSAPVRIIDLNNLTDETYPAHFSYLAPHRVMVSVRSGEEEKVGFYNIYDTSSVKYCWRKLFAERPGKAYLLAYYPHIEEAADGGLRVNMNYTVNEGLAENLIGRNDFEGNLGKALWRFETAFAGEDQYLEGEKAELEELLTPELTEKIRQEPPLDYNDIYRLMLVMQNTSCEDEVREIFSISDQDYSGYETRIEEILETGQGMSPAAFLIRAAEACDGRITLAALISYNLLFRKGQTVYNSLFVRYPSAFQLEENLQDQAGAVYHFMGCFFSAYALQNSLVHKYYAEPEFRAEIDREIESLQEKVEIDYSSGEIDGISEYGLLLLLQLRALKEDRPGQRELMTMAGIFYEEVIEDREITREVEFDFRGMAAGHAMYEIISGETLTRQGEWLSYNDNRRESFTNLLRYYAAPETLAFPQQVSLIPWVAYLQF